MNTPTMKTIKTQLGAVALAAFVPFAVLVLAACGTEQDDASTGREGDTSSSSSSGGGDWFKPTADTTWQWQIEGTVNTSYEADVYDIDAFENDAEVIAGLHQQGRRVVCYFSAGSYEPWQADAAEYRAEDIGLALADWPDERWVDIRSDAVRTLLAARLDVAASKGCDGVEPDNVTAFRNDSGFALTPDDQLDFNRWLADEAHARNLGVALKNDGEQAEDLAPSFDFSVNEECHHYDECDQLEPFHAAGKPVFNAEYAASASAAATLATTLCPDALAADTRTLILAWDLDDTFRVSCDDG